MNLYVQGLRFTAVDDDVRELFEEFGEVYYARVIRDHETGRSRGFAFVHMPDVAAQRAMEELDGCVFMGREIQVSPARPMRRYREVVAD